MTGGRRGTRLAVGALTALGAIGCGSDLNDTNADPTGYLAVPPRVGFEAVADAMQMHCGTLDCHGQVGRNMRLYGQYGLRLDPTFDPLNEPTSDAEYNATYESVAGLEPEAMSRVVRHVAAPDTLTMIRKPRGTELHKGGQLDVQGDPLDTCLVSWVTGAIDMNACMTVTNTQRPFLPKMPSPDGG